MNKPTVGVDSYISSLKHTNVIVLPPSPYFHQLNNYPITIGAQCISAHTSGSYTGELSADIAASAGCQYTLIGHSERRTHWHESRHQLSEQYQRALEHNITPIICLGETEEQRRAGESETVINEQIDSFRPLINFDQLIFAYEPVWAIGSKQAASTDAVEHIHSLIKSQTHSNTPVLYGGSVDLTNCTDFLNSQWVDGLLIGRASLDINIINQIASLC